MTFIVSLIALLIERFFDWSHLRHWNWFGSYQRTLVQRFRGQPPYVLLAITIVPLLLAVLIISLILTGVLYGFLSLVFQLAILLYCLGPQNLWADTFSSLVALTQGDSIKASEKLKAAFGITEMSNVQHTHREFLQRIFIEANRRIFTVVFWYVILGPVGPVLCRTISYTAHKEDAAPELMQSAFMVETIIEWLPARLFTVIFALGGHFSNVIGCWTKKVLLSFPSNDILLGQCGMAALALDEHSLISENGSTEREAISLLDRVFVIVLVVIAILAIV